MNSVAQRFSALNDANGVRFQRADLRSQLQAMSRLDGGKRLAEVIRVNDPAVEGVLVWELLCYVRRLGERTAVKLCRQCKVDSWTRTGSLSPSSRERVAFMVELYGQGLWPDPRAAATADNQPAPKPLPERKRHVFVVEETKIPNLTGKPACRLCGEHLYDETTELCGFCAAA